MRSLLASTTAELVSLVPFAGPFYYQRLRLKLSVGFGHFAIEPTSHHRYHFRGKLLGPFIRIFSTPNRIQVELALSSVMQKLAIRRQLGLLVHPKRGDYRSGKFRPRRISSVPSARQKRSGGSSEANPTYCGRIESCSNVTLRTGKALTRLRFDGLNVHNSTRSRRHLPCLISSIQNAFLNNSISSRLPDASTAAISKRISISFSR